ncbi:MAG: hypothetical protein R3A49_13810 [Acidimicrobiia bacterium]
MAILIILVLVGLWVAILVPPLLRARHNHKGHNSIGSFAQKLGSLGRTNGHAPSTPAGIGSSLSAPLSPRGPAGAMTPVQRRRRDVLVGLGAAVAATTLLALVVGGLAWLLPLVSLALLGAYVVLLLQIKQAAAERRAKVRYLSERRQGPVASPNVRPQASTSGLTLRRVSSH